MFFTSWLRKTTVRPAPAAGFRPRLESLNDRLVPSTLIVTNNVDSYYSPPAGSLRAEIAAAQPGDTIVFDQSLKGKTITLAGSELFIDKSIDIEGLGAKNLAVSGGNQSRVYEVAAGVQVTLAGMTIENGHGQPTSVGTPVDPNADYYAGGGVLNFGTLTLSNCTVTGNTAYSVGGGIANEQGGMMTIAGCTVSRNTDYGNNPVWEPSYGNLTGGGGIYNDGTLTLSGSTVTQNSAYRYGYGSPGGGILNGSSGSLTILSSTVKNNNGAYDIYSLGYLSIDSSTIGTVYRAN
jgi:parallel beta-helix repeat protein